MQKKTKIIIGAAALFIAVAVGLQVFIHTEKQKDIAKLNAAISTDSIQEGNTDAGDKLGVDTGDGTVQSGTTGTTGTTGGTSSQGSTAAPTPSASPTVTPAPSASPAPAATNKPEATPAATPKPTQKPVSNTPQDGDMRDNGGQTQTYIDGFGWVDYAGAGGEIEYVELGELSGNKVGQ